MWQVLGFLITIIFLIGIHEWGHFFVARCFGVKILRFSLGFGKPILSWTGKKDGTLYTIAPIPLGGFVQMYGERDDETIPPEERVRTFAAKSPYQRFLIAFAGPAVNLLFAICAFALLFMFGVEGLRPEIAKVLPNSRADVAGLQAGDVIERIHGSQIKLTQDAHMALIGAPREDIVVEFRRDGVAKTAQLSLLGLKAGDESRMSEVLGLYLVDSWFEAKIEAVVPDTSAWQMGLKQGDEIVALNGSPIERIALGRFIAESAGKSIVLGVKRGEAYLELEGVLGVRENLGKAQGFLGVQWVRPDLSAYEQVERYGVLTAFWRGMQKTWDYVAVTYKVFAKLLTGQAALENMGGPLTIGDMAGKSIRYGWDIFLNFLGIVSLSLAAINLLPVPMLDGGHMLFSVLEALRGKPLSETVMAIIYKIGMTVVVSFMVVVLIYDVKRYFF